MSGLIINLKNRYKDSQLLFGILIFGAILRIYHLDFQSLWLDEIHTVNESNPAHSFSEMYALIMGSEPQPQLYFMLVRWMFQLFGYTSFVLRLFSALCGIIGVWGIYLLGKEILDKRTGYFAAVLLSVNYFHIYYSQEGRMYSFLVATTIFSFYYLVRYIKKPELKTAIFYALGAAGMIYGHFFALFTLLAQYLILLYFVINPHNTSRKKFFLYSFMSGVVTLLMYLPTYPVFKKTAETKGSWIALPPADVFTQVFKDFFGSSELVLYFVVLLVVLYFVSLFQKDEQSAGALNPEKHKLTFSLLLLFTWILVSLLIPLIRSYTSIPMIVNRYLINVLPAIILVMALGLSQFSRSLSGYIIAAALVIFSLTDIIVVKRYYTNVTKDQFREVSHFIIENNTNNETVYTAHSYYFPFYLNNDKVKMKIVDRSLETLLNEMSVDSMKRSSFWYTDAGDAELKLSAAAQQFLDKNFEVENNGDFHFLWTRHYTYSSSPVREISISQFVPLKEKNGDGFGFHMDSFEFRNDSLKTDGFAYFTDQDATDTKIQLVIYGNQKAYKVQNLKVRRTDVTNYINNGYNLDNSGFVASLPIVGIPAGVYQLCLMLTDKKHKKNGLALSGKSFTIN